MLNELLNLVQVYFNGIEFELSDKYLDMQLDNEIVFTVYYKTPKNGKAHLLLEYVNNNTGIIEYSWPFYTVESCITDMIELYKLATDFEGGCLIWFH